MTKVKVAYDSCMRKYKCNFPWEENCNVKCGSKGLVFLLGKNTSYTTAFFESHSLKTGFIRGEGKTIIEAEENCWLKRLDILSCTLDHSIQDNFERRGYRNGLGLCKECKKGELIFEPLEVCVKCGIATFYTCDKNKNWWCKNCSQKMPEDVMSEMQKTIRNSMEENYEI